MVRITCSNNTNHSVTFHLNGGNINDIYVFADYDNEYWFTIGTGYKTVAGAKRAAVKAMAKHGYKFDEKRMKNLVIK